MITSTENNLNSRLIFDLKIVSYMQKIKKYMIAKYSEDVLVIYILL